LRNPSEPLAQPLPSTLRRMNVFLKYFAISFAIAPLIYAVLALSCIRAPVLAEYWVPEMIAVKRRIADELPTEGRIIVAGGSSVLFGVDAKLASMQLGLPVFNFGLHAGLRLPRLLDLIAQVTRSGDKVILQLEPNYFEKSTELSEWDMSATIGWDHQAWDAKGPLDKAGFIARISPDLILSMMGAEILKEVSPSQIQPRLDALDGSLAWSKFKARKGTKSFSYSVENFDGFGDIENADAALFKGDGVDPRIPRHISSAALATLQNFTDQIRAAGAQVFFINAPYLSMNPDLKLEELRRIEASFNVEIATLGKFIDSREELIMDRGLFFNTALHLNSAGRKLRTEWLVRHIRETITPRP
jgi:hypothetical protein